MCAVKEEHNRRLSMIRTRANTASSKPEKGGQTPIQYEQMPQFVAREHEQQVARANPLQNPACMVILVLQVLLMLGNGYLIAISVVQRSTLQAAQWIEPSQMSNDAHESLAIAVVVREGKDGEPEIWTRKRPASVDGRNRVYSGRWEALGKPLTHGESPVRALHTVFNDIFGFSEAEFENVHVMGTFDDDMHNIVTLWPDATLCIDPSAGEEELAKCRQQRDRARDRYFVFQNPYIYVQSLQGSTPWTAIGMVTLLNDPKKQNHLSIEGLEMRWWKASELLAELTRSPNHFTGVHYPVLLRAASDLQEGRLKVSDGGKFRKLTFAGHRQDGHFLDVVPTIGQEPNPGIPKPP